LYVHIVIAQPLVHQPSLYKVHVLHPFGDGDESHDMSDGIHKDDRFVHHMYHLVHYVRSAISIDVLLDGCIVDARTLAVALTHATAQYARRSMLHVPHVRRRARLHDLVQRWRAHQQQQVAVSGGTSARTGGAQPTASVHPMTAMLLSPNAHTPLAQTMQTA
jgi:hypothetical protein